MITGYTEKAILSKLKWLCDMSRNSFDNKRNEIKQNYKDYHNQWQTRKVYDRTIKTMTKIIKSVHAKQELEVKTYLEWHSKREKAKSLDFLMADDFRINKRDTKNNMKIEHISCSWVWLEIQDFNRATQRGDYILAHPLTWLPDPSYDFNYWHQFHWFELNLPKDEIQYWGFVNIDKLQTKWEVKIAKKLESKLQKKTNIDIDEINRMRDNLTYEEKNTYWIILQFCRFDWVPYMIWTDSEHQTILSCKEITWVTKEQKANPYLIDFPVTVTYLLPNPHDVYGDNLFTLIGDDQKMRQLFLNWWVEIARDQAWLWMYAVIEWAVKNPQDLFNPAEDNRTYIRIDEKFAQIADRVIQPLRSDKNTPQDIYNQTQVMEREMFFKVWYDQWSAWVVEWSATATENIRAQKNQNQITSFNETYISQAEVDFWMKRLELYARYGEKKIKFRMSIGELYMKNDFTPGAIRSLLGTIVLKPISKIKAKKDERKQFYLMYGESLLKNAKTEMEKYNIWKNICECEWLDDYEIEDILFEPTELIKAKNDLDLINSDIDPEITDIYEDHRAFLSVIRTAKEWKIKDAYIAKRLALISEVPPQWAQTQEEWNTGNIAKSMAISNRLWQQDAPSLSNISPQWM